MSKGRDKCSVLGCQSPHTSLHKVPKTEPLRKQWIEFIFAGNVPSTFSKRLHVCASHFTDECFLNLGQFRSGFAAFTKLKTGSIPTSRGPSGGLSQTVRTNAACQTDPPEQRSVRTQLSWKSLKTHTTTTGVQATVSCKDFGVGTDPVSYAVPQAISTTTPIQRPSKRPRLDMGEEDEGDPLKVNINTYTVYETCIMELFQECPVCQHVCEVKTRKTGTLLSVDQLCPHCQYSKHWNSQPILGSTPVGNLQLSTAESVCGASFFKLEKIFSAMKLQLFQYDTFRRNARSVIEPAIVNEWKTTQEVMLQQLSAEVNAIIGGDMRADSPDVQQLLVVKDEVPPKQQEWSSVLDKEDPGPPQFKKEQEDLWTSQEGEQLQELEDADTKFTFTPVPVKSENEDPGPPQFKKEQEDLWTNQEGEQLQELEEADTKFTITLVHVKSENEDEEDLEPPHIKEEQEDLWTSHEGEQLQELEEPDTKLTITLVPVKSEDEDEEKPQSSQLHID